MHLAYHLMDPVVLVVAVTWANDAATVYLWHEKLLRTIIRRPQLRDYSGDQEHYLQVTGAGARVIIRSDIVIITTVIFKSTSSSDSSSTVIVGIVSRCVPSAPKGAEADAWEVMVVDQSRCPCSCAPGAADAVAVREAG
jgi:hypothetical protein